MKYNLFYEDWLTKRLAGCSFSKIAKEYGCAETTVEKRVVFLALCRGIKLPPIVRYSNPNLKTPEDIFFSKVIIKEGCWGWNSYFNTWGYPMFKFGGKTIMGHSFSFKYHNNVKEIGKNHVCHTCDNPGCSNPAHLFLGTVSENMIDCRNKGRHRGFKLKISDIPNIRRMISNNSPMADIALKYSVDTETIRGIKNGKTWVGA